MKWTEVRPTTSKIMTPQTILKKNCEQYELGLSTNLDCMFEGPHLWSSL